MTGIILAGGKNSRMGAKKSLLNINGTTIIENIIEVYRRIFKEIIIVTNTPEDYSYPGIKLFKDIILNKGPMGGLYTGLLRSSYRHCFVAACDMPFIDEKLIRYMANIKDYDAVIPVVDGRYEPLFALYSKSCLDILKKQLDDEKLKIIDFFSKIKLREIHASELCQYDSKLFSFINVNTPGDYEAALSIGKNISRFRNV